MSNLYIWFETETERRAFILKLLEIPRLAKRNGSKKARREYRELVADLREFLDCLDAGKTKSPYFNLYKDYYNGRVPEWEKTRATLPWDPPVVFEKGFRQIYTQDSYYHRPGKWLIIQFRNTKIADERYQWVLGQIPTERLGINVPLPKKRIAEQKIEWVERVFNQQKQIKVSLLLKMYKALDYGSKECPSLFEGEKIYLWERLAFAFASFGHLTKAEACLRTQAALQPDKSDAFLNLGVFLADAGKYKEAIAAYREGLAITPDCEFLNYNLAALYSSLGRDVQAQSVLNDAILANPSRALNYFTKGEACLERGQYEAAIQYFLHTISLCKDEEWEYLKLDSQSYIAKAYRHLKRD